MIIRQRKEATGGLSAPDYRKKLLSQEEIRRDLQNHGFDSISHQPFHDY